MQPSPRIQLTPYYSAEMGVSLELPEDWHEGESNRERVSYSCTSEGPYHPQLLIQRVPLSVWERVSDGCDRLAEELLQLYPPPLEIRDRYPLTVDNFPARVDIFSFYDPEFNRQVTHYQACIQLPDALYSAIGIVERQFAESLLPVFEQAVGSIRFIGMGLGRTALRSDPLTQISYFNPRLGVSILIPASWSVQELQENQFQAIAPAVPELDGYHPRISCTRTIPTDKTPAGLEEAIRKSEATHRLLYSDYEILKQEQFSLGPHLAYLRQMQWSYEGTDIDLVNVQGLIWTPSSAYVFKAETLKQYEPRDVPIFEAIVKSTRIIPDN
ncbi:hypothetical protein NG796_07375 [Laspinema sp. A4]|nr:hypothetical protein [Laspinema sp. D2d]